MKTAQNPDAPPDATGSVGPAVDKIDKKGTPLPPPAPDQTGSVPPPPPPEPPPPPPPPEVTESVPPPRRGPPPMTTLFGKNPADELAQAKKYFRAGHYGNAEQHFRRAVEYAPQDGEAWIGLAASYDRLKRFVLADRAYHHAIQILGTTPIILNNQGFSYMLRGDYPRAREKFLAAQAADPANPFFRNNLELLEETWRKGKVAR